MDCIISYVTNHQQVDKKYLPNVVIWREGLKLLYDKHRWPIFKKNLWTNNCLSLNVTVVTVPEYEIWATSIFVSFGVSLHTWQKPQHCGHIYAEKVKKIPLHLQSMKRTCIQSVLQRVSRHPALPVGLVLSSRRFLPGSGIPAWVPTQPDLGPGPNHRPRTSPHRTSHQASSCLFLKRNLIFQNQCARTLVENLLALKDEPIHVSEKKDKLQFNISTKI